MAEDTTTTKKTNTTEETPEVKAAPAPKRKKSKRSVPHGQVHILASFNNTIITITDNNGGALTYSSAGAMGFRGSKKGTAYAAQIAAEKALSEAKQNHGLAKADVYVRGIGLGRDTAIRALSAVGIALENLHDVTGIPHGGVRPRKAKRN